MYRYYLVKDKDMPKLEENYGTWNAIHLGSHGNSGKGWNVLVLHDTHIPPHPQWKPFPRVVDSGTPVSEKVDHKLLADVGITDKHKTLEAMDILGDIYPPLRHP